eukprot:1016847_1
MSEQIQTLCCWRFTHCVLGRSIQILHQHQSGANTNLWNVRTRLIQYQIAFAILQKHSLWIQKCHDGNTGYLVIQIGQVDIDYVWYFRQMKYKNTLHFDDQIEMSINHLLSFLNDNVSKHSNQNVKVIIHGVHPPPLSNEDMKQKLYHHFTNRGKLSKQYLDDNLVLPSHKERTQMALRFNKRLKQKCDECEGKFVCVD